MYTQCPDCNKAYRITAAILRQASGKVRCGGCGVAFNALDRLTEEPPIRIAEDSEVLPVPDVVQAQAEIAVSAGAVSSEQGAALLETLDELAVPDVEIEDTGVEWRVLSEFDNDAVSTDTSTAETAADDALKFLLDGGVSSDADLADAADDDTDEVLQITDPTLLVDASSDDSNNDAVAVTDAEVPDTVDEFAEAMRFDDDTVLPDDFVDPDTDETPETTSEFEDVDSQSAAVTDQAMAELALSDTDDWQDLLGEVVHAEASSDASAADDINSDDDPASAVLGDSPMPPHEGPALATTADGDTDSEPESVATSFDDPERSDAEPALDDDDIAVDESIEEELMGIGGDGQLADDETAGTPEEHAFGADRESAMETIIMEGEFVRTAIEQETLDAAGALWTPEEESFVARAKQTFAGQLAEFEENPSRVRHVLIVCLVVLAMLLGLQIVHQSREALARMPLFAKTLAPVYALLGRPVTPAWDVGGWRFEVTQGGTNAGEDVLTIQSRVGNRSSDSLPYPLIHVALTNRYDDVIGNRILDPTEYLPDGTDPERRVTPGASFTATILIADPSPQATGFKLNVCYRLATGQLRCAIESFK